MKLNKKKGNSGIAILAGVLIAIIIIAASFAMTKGSLNTFKKANKKAGDSAISLFE